MLCLTGSPPLTVLSVITYLHARLDIEQNPLQDLLDHRPRSPRAPVPRSKAIRAISLTAASVNIRSAPWNRTSFLNCWISDPFVV